MATLPQLIEEDIRKLNDMLREFIASTEATIGILRDPSELSLVWLSFLACFDVVFLTAAWMVGEYLLEE